MSAPYLAGLVLASLGCGRVGFIERTATDADVLDSALDDASVAPMLRTQRADYGDSITATITLPDAVIAGDAVVVVALGQSTPVLAISDTLAQPWNLVGTASSPATGSKVQVWVACEARGGVEQVSVTQSFFNGPVHVHAFSVANASTDCIGELGESKDDVGVVDQVVTTQSPTTRPGEIVIAGFGAWLDAVTYTAVDTGDQLFSTVRNASGTDTLATVVSSRPIGVQSVHVQTSFAVKFEAFVVSIR